MLTPAWPSVCQGHLDILNVTHFLSIMSQKLEALNIFKKQMSLKCLFFFPLRWLRMYVYLKRNLEFSKLQYYIFRVLFYLFYFICQKERKADVDFHLKLRFIYYKNCLHVEVKYLEGFVHPLFY